LDLGSFKEYDRSENGNIISTHSTFLQDGADKKIKKLWFKLTDINEALPDHGNEDHSGPVVPNPTPKNGIKSLSNAGIERIDIRSGYTGSGGAKIGANDGELSFENRWFKSDTLDTVYERKDTEQEGDLSSLAESGKSLPYDGIIFEPYTKRFKLFLCKQLIAVFIAYSIYNHLYILRLHKTISHFYSFFLRKNLLVFFF